MFYFLEFNIVDEKKHIMLNGTLYDQNNLEVGRIFDDGDPEVKMPVSFSLVLDGEDCRIKKRKLTDKINTFANGVGFLFFVSKTVKKLFDEEGITNLGYYPVEIISEEKIEDSENFLAVKVFDKIDCVDIEKSELELYSSGNISGAEKIVLKNDLIPKQQKIFILGKRNSPTIMIHENLKNAIENANLTGFKFYPLHQAYMIL